MEFDDIKNAWKSSFEGEKLLNRDEIEAKLKIKSKSGNALRKVKRNYIIELLLNTFGTIFLIFWILRNIDAPENYILSTVTAMFLGVLTWICWINYKRIKNIVISSEQLKPAIIRTINGIEYYVNFYKSKLVKYVLMPFSIMFGMFIGFFAKSGKIDFAKIVSDIDPNVIIANINAEKFAYTLDAGKILSLILVLVIVSLLMLPVLQYYNKKMYKQHLDQLKKCLNEFEDLEDESKLKA